LGRLVAQRAGDGEVGRRAADRIARPAPAHVLRLGEAALIEIGQLQILEEQVEVFLRGQREAEIVVAPAVGAAFRAGAAASLGLGDLVAFKELLVAGHDVLAHPAGRAAQLRLAHAAHRDRDFAALLQILDVAVLRIVVDRAADQGLGAAQEALPVGEALSSGVQAPVDDMHLIEPHAAGRISRPVSPSCTIPPAGGPAARCSRG
jgi:hypothetical protein